MKKGKYENDYYIIGCAICIDQFGNRSPSYRITWLDNGIIDCGYDTDDFARKTADRIAHRIHIRNGLKLKTLV